MAMQIVGWMFLIAAVPVFSLAATWVDMAMDMPVTRAQASWLGVSSVRLLLLWVFLLAAGAALVHPRPFSFWTFLIVLGISFLICFLLGEAISTVYGPTYARETSRRLEI